jgi:hypothetical protein
LEEEVGVRRDMVWKITITYAGWVGLTDVPGRGRIGLAIVPKKVFLWIVEVGLEGDAGVGFEEWGASAAEVDAVVLGAGLEEDARGAEWGEGKGGEEIGQESGERWRGEVCDCTVNVYELLGIGPCSGAGFGLGLSVRIEEDDVCGDFGVLERFGDVFGLGEEVRGHVLDAGALLFGQKSHHLGRWWAAGDGVDLLPTLGRFEQDTHGVEAWDSIGAGDQCGQAFDVRREGWKVFEDAWIFQREVFGTHDGGWNWSVDRKGKRLYRTALYNKIKCRLLERNNGRILREKTVMRKVMGGQHGHPRALHLSRVRSTVSTAGKLARWSKPVDSWMHGSNQDVRIEAFMRELDAEEVVLWG